MRSVPGPASSHSARREARRGRPSGFSQGHHASVDTGQNPAIRRYGPAVWGSFSGACFRCLMNTLGCSRPKSGLVTPRQTRPFRSPMPTWTGNRVGEANARLLRLTAMRSSGTARFSARCRPKRGIGSRWHLLWPSTWVRRLSVSSIVAVTDLVLLVWRCQLELK